MSRRASGAAAGPRVILLLLAVAVFTLTAFGVNLEIGNINIGTLGLALFAASFLFP